MRRWVRGQQDGMAHTRMIILDAITAFELAAAAGLGEQAFSRPPAEAGMS
jgi:hypothetical protein